MFSPFLLFFFCRYLDQISANLHFTPLSPSVCTCNLIIPVYVHHVLLTSIGHLCLRRIGDSGITIAHVIVLTVLFACIGGLVPLIVFATLMNVPMNILTLLSSGLFPKPAKLFKMIETSMLQTKWFMFGTVAPDVNLCNHSYKLLQRLRTTSCMLHGRRELFPNSKKTFHGTLS